MPDRDIALLRAGDIPVAIALLTRLPVWLPETGIGRGAAAAWAYPVAGLVVGAIAAGIAGICGWLGLPATIGAGFALLAMIACTGGLHEDGLADSADGLWGGWTPERRLEIMKDSHIGTYGVLALILSLGLRWAALASIASHGGIAAALISAAILSRAPMVALMYALPPARGTGLSSAVGRPGGATTMLGLGLTLFIGAMALGSGVLPVAAALCATTAVIALIARAKVGGQTGDILGATQQISEIAILVFIAA